MIYLNETQLLSCTAGQLPGKGINIKELETFGYFFKKNLGSHSVLITFPNGRIKHYDDSWRNHFEYFMGEYFLINSGTVKSSIILLLNDLIKNGFSKKQSEKIIETSIMEFKQTHSNLHGDEFISQKPYSYLLKKKN